MSTAGSGFGIAGVAGVGNSATVAGTVGVAGTSVSADRTAAGTSASGDPAAMSGGPASVATFSAVFAIFVASGCGLTAACHQSEGASKLELTDAAASHTALVGVAAMGVDGLDAPMSGCVTGGLLRVKAGDPDNSLLMQKLRGTQTCGAPMPPGGELDQEQQLLIRAWISAGAKND